MKLVLDFDFCTRTDFSSARLSRHHFSVTHRNILEKIWNFLCVILICIWNFNYIAFFDLSHGSASKKFVFMDCSVLIDSVFSFAFSILLFSVWFSLLHLFSVAIVYVSKCWVCLCQGLTWEFWLCTNPLMRITMRLWCEGSFQVLIEENDVTWSRRVKSQSLGMSPWYIPEYLQKTQASKLGDAQGIPFFINKVSGHL